MKGIKTMKKLNLCKLLAPLALVLALGGCSTQTASNKSNNGEIALIETTILTTYHIYTQLFSIKTEYLKSANECNYYFTRHIWYDGGTYSYTYFLSNYISAVSIDGNIQIQELKDGYNY